MIEIPPSVSSPSGYGKDAIRLDAQRAVAIAHGRGAGMSLLALFALVLEDGIPSRAERERMLAERLKDGAGDTTSADVLRAALLAFASPPARVSQLSDDWQPREVTGIAPDDTEDAG